MRRCVSGAAIVLTLTTAIPGLAQDSAALYQKGYEDGKAVAIVAGTVCSHNGDSVLVVSERVGDTIDSLERKQFGLFLGTQGFMSAQFIKISDSSYVALILYEKDGRDTTKRISMSKDEFRAVCEYVDSYAAKSEVEISDEVAAAPSGTAREAYDEGYLDGRYAADRYRKAYTSRGALYSGTSTILAFSTLAALTDGLPVAWPAITCGCGLLAGSVAVLQAKRSSVVPRHVPSGTPEYEQGFRDGYATVRSRSKVRNAAFGACLGTGCAHGAIALAGGIVIALFLLFPPDFGL